jgi:hypothetical protein
MYFQINVINRAGIGLQITFWTTPKKSLSSLSKQTIKIKVKGGKFIYPLDYQVPFILYLSH